MQALIQRAQKCIAIKSVTNLYIKIQTEAQLSAKLGQNFKACFHAEFSSQKMKIKGKNGSFAKKRNILKIMKIKKKMTVGVLAH